MGLNVQASHGDVPTTRTAALPERRTLDISDIDCAISEKYRRSILALVESNSVRAEIVLSEDSGRIGPPWTAMRSAPMYVALFLESSAVEHSSHTREYLCPRI